MFNIYMYEVVVEVEVDEGGGYFFFDIYSFFDFCFDNGVNLWV